MKLFSRKAVAAVATTVALTTAGLSAPAFAADNTSDEDNSSVSTVFDGSSDLFAGSSADDDDDTTGNTEDGDNEGGGSSDEPDEIRSWISVFTAVVGALSAAFVFVQKLTA